MEATIGTHSELVVGLHSDAVFLPSTFHVLVRELHLKRGGLTFHRFLVSQAFADGDFSSWIRGDEE